MLDRSFLSLGLVLFGASCVPPASLGVQANSFSALSSQGSGTGVAAPEPGFSNVATVPLPSPEAIAEAIAPGAPAQPFEIAHRSPADVRSAAECLTAAVYYEARSESEEGQRAVAQVVLNRVRHPAFPNSVCGVVYQGSARSTGCQFSFTCDGSLRRSREPAAWTRAARIAAEALSGSVYAPVGLATNYHTTAIRPWWAASMTRAITVGSHIFYRWRGEWGDPTSFRRPYLAAEARGAVADRQVLAQAAPEQVFGVSIHRGDTAPQAAEPEQAFGLRIHRGSGRRPADSTPVLADASAAMVKVHRGATPAPAETTLASADPAPASDGGAALTR
jgi:hypothetical protein